MFIKQTFFSGNSKNLLAFCMLDFFYTSSISHLAPKSHSLHGGRSSKPPRGASLVAGNPTRCALLGSPFCRRGN